MISHRPSTQGEHLKEIRDQAEAILEIIAGFESIRMDPAIAITCIKARALIIQDSANDVTMESLL